MFKQEKKEFETNKEILIKVISDELNINKNEVLPLALDYLTTLNGYKNIKKDIKKKLENDEK